MDEKPALGHRLPALTALMNRLLAPDGCPWDREQTFEILRRIGQQVRDAFGK